MQALKGDREHRGQPVANESVCQQECQLWSRLDVYLGTVFSFILFFLKRKKLMRIKGMNRPLWTRFAPPSPAREHRQSLKEAFMVSH